jgi:hypothetical protein
MDGYVCHSESPNECLRSQFGGVAVDVAGATGTNKENKITKFEK